MDWMVIRVPLSESKGWGCGRLARGSGGHPLCSCKKISVPAHPPHVTDAARWIAFAVTFHRGDSRRQ